ncbi:MAG: hypothetical protein IJ609_01430 [Paludibacteraceae bacterium]|nr:hypothetical protein [Paludibacteraceae bacterium]
MAKFEVTYMDVNTVGPVENLPAPSTKMNLIYEQTFNFDPLSSTQMVFWNGHFEPEESTYGYYFNEKKSVRGHHPAEPNWSEYGVVNKQDTYNVKADSAFNHVDGKGNLPENAKEGYFLFVDGSQQPGLVFNLKVNADLCPGSRMYFSAWLIDVSTNTSGTCAPNMNFTVMGIDGHGKEHALTTFTTGEFGINAKAVVGKSGNMNRAKWYQIMFPVTIDKEHNYHAYRLKILNKGKSSDGNDFAIDDIRIYVQKPPVMPIQASTYDCPDSGTDSITAYLRIDYQAIKHDGSTLYYQWRDYNDDPMNLDYFGDGTTAKRTYGYVENVCRTDDLVEATEEAHPGEYVSSSLLQFDADFHDTDVPVVRYIKEQVDATTERYVMYIAQPMVVKTNYTYTGFIASDEESFGDRSDCGTFADLMIAGGTRIQINGEPKGDSIVDICGHRSYTMDIVLTYIAHDSVNYELVEYTTPCRADWLIGDSSYVNTHSGVYKYTFAQISAAVEDNRKTTPSAETTEIITHLLKNGLLVPDTATTTLQPAKALSYTAFPVGGSAANRMAVCLTPRFLYISPSVLVENMMAVGDASEELPKAIANQPRRIRISNAAKRFGAFPLELHIQGDNAIEYIVDTVLLVSSTNPAWTPVYLHADKEGKLAAKDTIVISGEDLQLLEPGYDYTFHVRFKDEDTGCERGYTYFTLRVVPDEVTWQGGDWNVDASWDHFMPLAETDVILKPGTDYNVTFSSDSVYDFNYTRNCCHNIYLPSDASLAGQEKLRISGRAFVDIKEHANKWTLTAIPIKGVVTGDIFASQSESTRPFVVANINQTVGAPAYDRTVYEVYNSEYDATRRKWKTTTNTLVRPMVAGEGCMIGIDCAEGLADPVIRLPKADDTYRYYDGSGHTWMASGETVVRAADYGKPVYEGEASITLKEVYEGVYLFGNPTLGYLDITRLVEMNSSQLTGRYYMAEGVDTRPRDVLSAVFENDVKTADEDVLLPPCRAVLLEGKGAGSDVLTLRVVPAMVNARGRVPERRWEERPAVATDVWHAEEEERVCVYDLMGRAVSGGAEALPRGIYIVVSGGEARKVLMGR